MLNKIRVKGFKSLADVSVSLPRMAVLFGPNSAGKSNLVDALLTLSRVGTERMIRHALEDSIIRGHAFELFQLPKSGIAGLASRSNAQFSIEAYLTVPESNSRGNGNYVYKTNIGIDYRTSRLTNCGEFLTAMSKSWKPKGKPAIEVSNDQLSIRRQSGGGRPRIESLGINYTVLSDARLARPSYKYIERVRSELQDWRTYYLDPRIAMRAQVPPKDVSDIGVLGQDIMPFLYKLKGEEPKLFQSMCRTISMIVPSISSIDVNLDRHRGMLEFSIEQDSTAFSSRIVSEGTLRVIALCALCVNPWSKSLIAFEEPENGVHPCRIELIARMLVSMAVDFGRQVVVTTHSPLFCDAVLREARSRSVSEEEVGLLNVRRDGIASKIEQFDTSGTLFEQPEILEALSIPVEDHLFESLVLGGYTDA